MKNINIIITVILITFSGFSAFSQGGGIWHFNWNTGFPTGSTKDFVSNPTGRGFTIEGSGFVTDRITVGGIAGWNVFYDEIGWVTETLGNTTINGYKKHYLNTLPIMVTGHYFFSTGLIQPFIGVGLGTYYMETRNLMGIYYVKGDDWHFGVAPEVGVAIPFGAGNAGINFNFKYNYAAKTKDNDAQSWIGLNLGLSYIF